MTLRRRLALVVVACAAAGLLLATGATYVVNLLGAEGVARQWMKGVYENGAATWNQRELDALAREGALLAASRELEPAFDADAEAAVAGALDRSWLEHRDDAFWYMETAEGEVMTSLPACRGAGGLRELAERDRGFARCGDTPVMVAEVEAPGGRALYFGRELGGAYVDALWDLAGVETLLVADGDVLAATFRDTEGARVRPELSEAALEAVGSEGSHFGSHALTIPSYRGYHLSDPPVQEGESEVEHYIYAATLDTADGSGSTRLVLTLPAELMRQSALYSSAAIGGVSVLILGALALVATGLAGRITRPLGRLTDAALRFGSGEMTARVGATGGGPELETVGEAFDGMAERLEELRAREKAQAEEADLRAEEAERARGELQETHDALVHAQRRLVDASRQAGMAEVATNVLHNVGNVLNTVNVSTDQLQRQLEGSKLPSLQRVLSLLPRDREGLMRFAAEDPRADDLSRFLEKLADRLDKEHEQLRDEVSALTSSVEHLKLIVYRQQDLARGHGHTELIEPSEVVDAAIGLQTLTGSDASVELLRDYEALGSVPLDRHRIVQIVTNLVSNAKHAVRGRESPRITVRIRAEAASEGNPERRWLRVDVEDNGAGIDPAHKTAIFQHGFTTKDDGHGFGLHSSANAAREVGGTLCAESEGSGRGATFTLWIPLGDDDGESVGAA